MITMSDGRPPIRSMIKDAVADYNGSATHKKIINWINEKYNDVNENTIRAQINACTVNSPSRVGMPECSKPREYDDRYDFLFTPKSGSGVVEFYEPKIHGKWTIMKNNNGKITIAQDGVPISDSSVETLSFEKLKDILTNIKLPRNYLPTTIRFLLKNYPNNCAWKKISEEIERLNSFYQDTQTGRVNTAKEMVVEQQSWNNFLGVRCLDEKGELTKKISKATTCYLDVSDMSEDQTKELIEICGKKIAQIHIRMREEGLV